MEKSTENFRQMRHRRLHSKAARKARGGAEQHERRIFIGAWVPARMAAAVNQAVRVLDFKDRSQFLRSVLETAVEDVLNADD